ncbi:unnamed protein product [Spodoptera exigua]|nr:unnamed protein product [Spodoptera exigua]
MFVASTADEKYHEYDDRMGKQDKEKIIALTEELVVEAVLQMRQLFAVKEEHAEITAFHVGLIIGKVREKYQYMLDLYNELMHKRHKRLKLYPPGMNELKPIYYIITMELVHYLEMEIDYMLKVLEEEALPGLVSDRLSTVNIQIGKPPSLEQLQMEQEEMTKKKEMEQAKKSLLRQRYLMKKLGMPPNMTTTRKRFVQRWPVEETWDLDKYNYH